MAFYLHKPIISHATAPTKPFIPSHSTRRKSQTCHASRATKNQQLIDVLRQQFTNETLPWLQDIVFPILGVKSDDIDQVAETQRTVPPTALADADSKFVHLSLGLRVHYKERRPTTTSSEPPATIVLIHGFNGSAFSWRSQLDALSEATGCRVIAFDRAPFGLSERPLHWGRPGQALTFNPYELAGSVKIAEALLDALAVSGPIIAIGHSAGALVALHLAKERRHQVTALGLVAPAVPTNSENSFIRRATFGSQLRFLATRAILESDSAGLRYVRRQLLRQRDKVAAGDLGFTPHPSTASSFSMMSMTTSVSDDDDENRNEFSAGASGENTRVWDEAAVAEQAMQEAVEGYLRPLQARDWDKAALLNLRAFTLGGDFNYSVIDEKPVLVVQGDDDGALTLNGRALAEILKERRRGGENNSSSTNAAAVVYKEMQCKHAPNEELPAEFNAAVIDFLKQHVL